MCRKHQHHSGKITEAIYLEVAEKEETACKARQRAMVFWILKTLGVSQITKVLLDAAYNSLIYFD